jgi:hypothetical protein
VSNNSSEFSSSSREESLELKLQIGAIDNELVQSSNKKLSRALTNYIEKNKNEICNEIPAVIVRRINHLRIGKNNLGKNVLKILNENTISRKNNMLGSQIFKSNNFLRPVCRRPSMQATAHMTQLSDKVLEKTLHLIIDEVVCKV